MAFLDSMEDAYVGVHGVGKLVGRGIGRRVNIGRFVGFATGLVLVLASGVVYGVCLCVEVLGVLGWRMRPLAFMGSVIWWVGLGLGCIRWGSWVGNLVGRVGVCCLCVEEVLGMGCLDDLMEEDAYVGSWVWWLGWFDHRAARWVGFGASSTLPGHTTTNHSYFFILVYSIHDGY